jgi:hypothetical protein
MRDVDFADAARLSAQLPGAAQVWIADFIKVYESGALLPKPRVAALQVSLPSDRSFASYEEALSHITGPRPDPTLQMVPAQAFFDVLLEYPVRSDRDAFSIRPGLGHLAARVVTVLRFLPPGGAVRAYEFTGDPGLVPLDPSWHQAAWRFVKLGFFHILDGTDHLLFLTCLVIPFRRFRPLVGVITAFTAAHSITLIGSAFDLAPDALWFPPLIEMLIAFSIVFMALENIAGGVTMHRRWIMAFAFGLVHGFGFSFALRENLQFAGSHLLTSLLSFNLGVELGQLLVLALLIPALSLCFRFLVAERTGTIILSALVAHTAWHWMTERYDRLAAYHPAWPDFNAAWMSGALRGAMWIVVLAGLFWLIRYRVTRTPNGTSPR